MFDHYFYNDEGYYDLYEVGGRWDNFFRQDNFNNVLEDISLLKGTSMVERIHTLDFFETLCLKQEEIDNKENLENRFPDIKLKRIEYAIKRKLSKNEIPIDDECERILNKI